MQGKAISSFMARCKGVWDSKNLEYFRDVADINHALGEKDYHEAYEEYLTYKLGDKVQDAAKQMKEDLVVSDEEDILAQEEESKEGVEEMPAFAESSS